MELYVEYESYCTDSYHSGEQYGDWHEHRDHRIEGVRLSKPSYSGSEKFTVDYDVKPGDNVYVLVMVYGTGDSFGHSTGNVEILWVFKDIKVAREAERKINNLGEDAYSMKIKTDSGKTIQLSNPSAGYFESLEHLHIQVCEVQK